MLDELRDSLKEKGLTFTYDVELVKWLVKKSYSAACRLLTTLDSMLDKLINDTIR